MKKKHLSVTKLNEMMRNGAPLFEMIEACAFIDICDFYEPMETQPEEYMEPEPTFENTSFYGIEPDGTKYFYCGNTRTRVSEFFDPNGKTMDNLIENVVRFVAGNTARTSMSIG